MSFCIIAGLALALGCLEHYRNGSTDSQVCLTGSSLCCFGAGGKVAKPGKKLSKSVVATLEMVHAQNPNPKEEVVLSIVDLHNIPRRVVLDWFKERRERRQRQESYQQTN